MKPIHGLILAIGLGIAGALFNFAYLAMKARDVEKIEFWGIKADQSVAPGERLTEAMLERVGVPKKWAGNLEDYALPADALDSVVGAPVWRMRTGGSLLVNDDLRTPPEVLSLGDEYGALGVRVARNFPLDLLVPGDQVTFLVNKSLIQRPTRAVFGSTDETNGAGTSEGFDDGTAEEETSGPAPSTGGTAIVGPFTVLSIGNRLGTIEVMKAAKVRPTAPDVITVRVKIDSNGQLLEEKTRTLVDLLTATDFRDVGIIKH
ncbi:MAG TPA: hypothetical protein VMY42_00210 [Thermoguttaceae bacterium]|nr:hypothetical protein [Thermoguttaceae bacterium]